MALRAAALDEDAVRGGAGILPATVRLSSRRLGFRPRLRFQRSVRAVFHDLVTQ
jgi:hypothetical protein